jgi:transcriptional regulator with XRE-family HTH domain
VNKYLKYIAANIRRIRRRRGMTQVELGERSGVDAAFIQRVEGAKTNLSVVYLARIARALGVGPAELLAEVSFVPPPRGRPRRDS